ncbi:MAG: hypothetical protein ABI678_16060 [Kofleriaceae bacterium]
MSLKPYLLLCLLGACVGDAPEDEVDYDSFAKNGSVPITIVQHNIEKRNNVFNLALHHAMNAGALGIALEEVCPGEVAYLKANFPKWTIVDQLQKTPANVGCDNAAVPTGHDIPSVIAIYTGGNDGQPDRYPVMSAPANSPGVMACVKFDHKGVPVHLCAAHLISANWTEPTTKVVYNGEEMRGHQTDKIRETTNEWIGKGHFAIVAGDFNGKPETAPMDKMYDRAFTNGAGHFTEYNRDGASRQGQDTAESSGDHTETGDSYARKIDYVFFSTNRAPINGQNANITPDDSDHNMVTSTVQMKKG